MEKKRRIILCICLLWNCYDCSSACQADSDCPSKLFRCDVSAGITQGICEYVVCNGSAAKCPQNAVCSEANTCQCAAGYTVQNGECTKVIGRACTLYSDCDGDNTICSDNECVCNTYNTWDNNGVCESVYGRNCTKWSECGSQSWNNVRCTNGTCQCKAGTEWNSANKYCKQIINNKRCSDDNDCPLENSYCYRSSNIYSNSGYCKCVIGAVQNNYICVMVLESSCDDVNCYQSTGETYCDVDNICKCRKGYKADENKTCVAVAFMFCNDTITCGEDISFTCIDNQCVCAEHFQRNYDSHLNYYGTVAPSCISEIGLLCTETNCSMDHAACQPNGTAVDICDCEDGYAEDNGRCIKVLGGSCLRDEQCAVIDTTLLCNTSGMCECKPGYIDVNGVCTKVLGSSCQGLADCSMITNAICDLDKCVCPATYAEFENICLRQECHVSVVKLPDIYRRSIPYSAGYNEPQISDIALDEGWYSIGPNTLSAREKEPQIGQCGTYYPIYLTAELTNAQKKEMETGSTINVTAMVGGIEQFGLSEEIEVRIRQCGGDTQVYLKPPSRRMAAYCIEHNIVSKPAVNSATNRPYVYITLNFTEEMISGMNKFIPNILAECRSQNIYYGNIDVHYDEGLFRIIDWYINDKHFATYGPSRKWNELHLSESDILNAGYTLGFTLQCSIKYSETSFGQWSSPRFSTVVVTGVAEEHYNIWNPGSDTELHQTTSISTSTPLGCATDVTNEAWNCTMKFDVIDEHGDSVCNQGPSHTERHYLCGRALMGVTKIGWEQMPASHSGWDSWRLNRRTFYNPNGTYVHENIGTHIQTFADEDHKGSNNMKVKFEPSSDTGHRLWKGYTLPNLNVYVERDWQYMYCQLSMNNGQFPSITSFDLFNMMNPSSFSEGVQLQTVGEYILFRSKHVPFEVQIKTEECYYGVCVCATTYRNGNDIYTSDSCGGSNRVGHIYGDGPSEVFRYLNGMNMYIYQPNMNGYNSYYGYTSIYQDVVGMETFAEAEGLCTFTTEGYKSRMGSVSSDMDGFAQSWKIPAEESLLNPLNHIRYSWTEEFYMCSCPNSTANISDMVVTQTNSLKERRHIHTGVLKCTLENLCYEQHAAENKEWQPLPLPDYYLGAVSIRVVPHYSGNEPIVDIMCDFNATDGYLYKVEWKIKNDVSHDTRKSDFLPAEEATSYKLTYAFSAAVSIELDVQLVCGVSVYTSDKQKELIPTQYSDYFTPVEIISTEINMIRGGSAVISLKLHLPLACKRDSECYLDFTVYDPDDKYDCRDSTIAVKSKTTCGERIRGASSQEQFVVGEEMVNIIVTTKNNNKYRLRDTFSLRVKVDVSSSESSWKYTGNLNSTFTVFVRDDAYWQRTYCYASNDPRMRTFDGIYYSNQINGEFIMYRHTKYHAEIQMMTMPCNGGWASCSCGVTIRAGKDVYIINHCGGQHMTGYLIAEDNALIVRERTQNRYQIVLPHGTTVDVHVNPWRWYLVNIYIYPSPADVGYIQGLCGNFNGNYEDDLTYRDGTVETTRYWWWYNSPDDFSRSWKLADNDTESLIQAPDVLANILESWDEHEQLCVCPGNHGTSDAICSANEDDTCTENIDKPGKRLGVLKREKRSVRINRDIERRIKNIRRNKEIKHVVKRSVDTTNITLEEALEKCIASMVTCQIFNMSSSNSTPQANTNNTIRDCAEDYLLNPEVEWGTQACSAIQIAVENEVQRDTVFQEDHPDAVAELEDLKCIGNCAGHGTCVNGSCVCQNGYDGDDCGLDRSKAPSISDTSGGGVCDSRTGDCDCISLTADGYVRQPKCRIEKRTAGIALNFSEVIKFDGDPVYRSFNEIDCCIPSNKREKRSADTEVAQILSLSVSNDGTNFGAAATVFVMDTTCQNITIGDMGDYVAVLQAGYCFIEGACLSNGNKRTNSDCDVCVSETNAFTWTTDHSNDGCTDEAANSITSTPTRHEKDAGIQGYVIGLIAFGDLVLAGLLTGCVVHKCMKSKVVVHDVGLYDNNIGPANKKFNLRKEPPMQAWMTG